MRMIMSDSLANHAKVISAVKHGIAEGRYAEGPLPSYRQLARQLNVSMANVRRAMAQMESEGIIRREKCRGAFLRESSSAPVTVERTALRCVNFVVPAHPLAPFLYASYLEGHTDALDGREVRARHLSLGPNERDFARLLSPDHPIEAQGFVLVGCPDVTLARWLSERQVPYVVQCFARYSTEGMPEHNSIYVNKAGGASQAVNHLLALGHRRIGFIGGVDPINEPTTRVFEGYRAAMDCAGIGCRDRYMIHHESEDPAATMPMADRLLARPDRPTAILAGNDNMAMGVLQAARMRHLRVPEDLSVIGFNNQPETEQSDPPLTTVSVPRRQLAKGAVELLFEAVERRSTRERRVLECHLIVRKSTAPPMEEGGR